MHLKTYSILPQEAMNTFNKATAEGELKWVNLLHVAHTYCASVCACMCVCVCMCVCGQERETIAPTIAWSGCKSRDQGHVPFSSSMNLSSVLENEIKRFILWLQTSSLGVCVTTSTRDRDTL